MKLSATYEQELHAIVEELVASQPSDIVNIGAADGYYAIGLALRCPTAPVVAFESDAYLRDQCRRLQIENARAMRLSLHGECTVRHLQDLKLGHRPLLICDCEGAEIDLVDPERVDWLSRSALLIEVHEFVQAGLEAVLTARLESTHVLTVIRTQERFPSDAPAALTRSTAADRLLAVAELRPAPMSWIIGWPILPPGAGGE